MQKKHFHLFQKINNLLNAACKTLLPNSLKMIWPHHFVLSPAANNLKGNKMSDCNCKQNDFTSSTAVPNFTVTGFGEHPTLSTNVSLEGVEALKLSVCVSASYDPNTNKICFNVPIYGNLCITSPVHIPVGGQLKACAQTCGSFIPTGLKVTIYLNNTAIYSGTVVGRC